MLAIFIDLFLVIYQTAKFCVQIPWQLTDVKELILLRNQQEKLTSKII